MEFVNGVLGDMRGVRDARHVGVVPVGRHTWRMRMCKNDSSASTRSPLAARRHSGLLHSDRGKVPMSYPRVFSLIALVLASAVLIAQTDQAEAATVNFTGGGTCDIIDQANGIRLDNCVNNSGQTANDLHVTFTFAGLPTRTLNIDNAFLCGIITTCQFGPDVPNGGTWEGIGGAVGEVSNPTIWNVADIGTVDVNLDQVVATGNWTYDGVSIAPIPIGATLPLALLGLAALFGLSPSRKRRLLAS